MDIVQAAATFAAGAAGCLSMYKLVRAMERRRTDTPKSESIFPNGERDKVIQALSYLREQNNLRATEITRLATSVQEISERLERAGI